MVTPSTKIGLEILEALTLDVQTATFILAPVNNFFELQPFEVFGVTNLLKLSFSFSRLVDSVKFLHIRIPLEKWHFVKKRSSKNSNFTRSFAYLKLMKRFAKRFTKAREFKKDMNGFA